MPSPITGRPVSDRVWVDLRTEFTLPTLEQVRRRLTELTDDPEPVMQQLVRIIGDGTYCPGFQFLAGGQLHPTVVSLFRHALELRLPHNYFTAWMITPEPELGGVRPVDSLREMARLHRTLEAFATELPSSLQASRRAVQADPVEVIGTIQRADGSIDDITVQGDSYDNAKAAIPEGTKLIAIHTDS